MDLHLRAPLVKDLLSWFHRDARVLPWRVLGRNHPDPYHVWLSEIMLQQTTVATVTPYFQAFTQRWPTLHDLAQAELDEVLTQWQGLGYYSRARNLHKAAQTLVATYQGAFPQHIDQLEKIPGIGPYTAAALGAIAFDLPVVPVDGNIARVYARLTRLDTPLPDLLKVVRREVQCLTHPGHQPLPLESATPKDKFFHHGDLAQALMDLGARVCTPKKPSCDKCPVRPYCGAFHTNQTETLPLKKPTLSKPVKYMTAFYVENSKGEIWLQQRPETGLLARMMEVPSTPWTLEKEEATAIIPPLPLKTWQICPQPLKHTFTHFHLICHIWRGTPSDSPSLPKGQWHAPEALASLALPTLMKKIIQKAQAKQ